MTTPTPPAAVQMPELPHPTHPTHVLGPLWSADQMHTYAQAYAAQHTQELEARLAAAGGRVVELTEALFWIARVNAMDYEYQAKARAALTPKEQQ